MVNSPVSNTMVNLTVALAVPRFIQRFGNGRLLAGALLVSVIGDDLAGPDHRGVVLLPILLIGAGQGTALSPLTVAGVAGAPSGLVNVAHQLSGSLRLAVLVAVFATAGTDCAGARADLAHRIAAAPSTGALPLALAPLVILITAHPQGEAASATTQRC